jgi:hypothetical protein
MHTHSAFQSGRPTQSGLAHWVKDGYRSEKKVKASGPLQAGLRSAQQEQIGMEPVAQRKPDSFRV